jgi:hypothetical protein
LLHRRRDCSRVGFAKAEHSLLAIWRLKGDIVTMANKIPQEPLASEKMPTESLPSDKEVIEITTPPEHDVEIGEHKPASLTRGLQGRHMQMIAIGKKYS